MARGGRRSSLADSGPPSQSLRRPKARIDPPRARRVGFPSQSARHDQGRHRALVEPGWVRPHTPHPQIEKGTRETGPLFNLAERVGFEPTCRNYPTIRFRVGAVMTASVPLHSPVPGFEPTNSPRRGPALLHKPAQNATKPLFVGPTRAPFFGGWYSSRTVPPRGEVCIETSRYRGRQPTRGHIAGRLHAAPFRARPDPGAQRNQGRYAQYPYLLLLWSAGD